LFEDITGEKVIKFPRMDGVRFLHILQKRCFTIGCNRTDGLTAQGEDVRSFPTVGGRGGKCGRGWDSLLAGSYSEKGGLLQNRERIKGGGKMGSHNRETEKVHFRSEKRG